MGNSSPTSSIHTAVTAVCIPCWVGILLVALFHAYTKVLNLHYSCTKGFFARTMSLKGAVLEVRESPGEVRESPGDFEPMPSHYPT